VFPANEVFLHLIRNQLAEQVLGVPQIDTAPEAVKRFLS